MSIGIRNVISVYPKPWDVSSKETMPLDMFFESIRNGKWEDYAHKVRVEEDKEKRTALKKKVPSVTISGLFDERVDNKLKQHSGFIGIDIDEDGMPSLNGKTLDITQAKALLSADKYVAAAFISISGRGLCVVFKISPDKHREAFQGIGEYLYNLYKCVIDPTSVNVSRARFVSYDPGIYVAEHCDKFTRYPKSKPPKKVEKVIFSNDDFHLVLQEIVSRRINLCENYHEWLRIGFALCQKFGEQGREYFHIVSQFSSKYDSAACDKQYTSCLRHEPTGKEASIKMFFHYAKEAGLDIYSERTRKIAHSASQGKRNGLTAEQVEENLSKFEDIVNTPESKDKVIDIVRQIMASGVELNDDSLLDQLEMFIRQNYNLQRNEITRYIENNSEILKQKDLNTIFVKAKKVLDRISYELVDRLINSDFVPTYNPFFRFFDECGGEHLEQLILKLKENPLSNTREPTINEEQLIPNVTKLFQSIQCENPDFALYFGKKWLVGAMSAIHGVHSPLMYVLSGEEQNTGKTEWFRRLMPRELIHYYAESKLDAGKDDEILMTQKWLIVDDEMGGKSKREVKRLKELTSKQTFSLREPYGRNNVDLVRLAVLGGTTNDNEILSDPTGNRRIIPVNVLGINQKLYNSIDKIELFVEAFAMYKAGYEWRLNKADIAYLGADNGFFEVSSSEAELIQKYFEPGDLPMTATEIKVFIEKQTNQRLYLDRLSKELKRMKYEQKHMRIGNGTKRAYMVNHITDLAAKIDGWKTPPKEEDDLPF